MCVAALSSSVRTAISTAISRCYTSERHFAAPLTGTEDSTVNHKLAASTAAFLLATGCSTAPPAIDTSANAEVSFDGLHSVVNTRADEAWARPDTDFSVYTKVMLQGAGIEYRPGGESGRTTISRGRGGPYEVTERQKQRLQEIVVDAFADELGRSETLEFVQEPGPDVLLVRGALLDVV